MISNSSWRKKSWLSIGQHEIKEDTINSLIESKALEYLELQATQSKPLQITIEKNGNFVCVDEGCLLVMLCQVLEGVANTK